MPLRSLFEKGIPGFKKESFLETKSSFVSLLKAKEDPEKDPCLFLEGAEEKVFPDSF